ncbi:hypothetical protein GQ53DRAFT_272027 [Thozetella sp. PMI_491]|nr:hypothetical protein GQ53DRAFT_272027 [Thozetella sp. PMI_491]
MAEILGVVASGIAVAQVAGEIGSTALKLKELCGRLKDVPEAIEDLMNQVDCLTPALLEAERLFDQNEVPSSLYLDVATQRSLYYCRNSWNRLSKSLDKFSTQISSKRRLDRNICRVKFVLKQDQLKVLEQRLKSALGMLQLVQQLCLITLSRAQLEPDMIADKIAARVKSLAFSAESTTGANETHTTRPLPDQHASIKTCAQENQAYVYHDKRDGGKKIRKSLSVFGQVTWQTTTQDFALDFQPPTWLTAVVYARALSIAKAYSGWKISLRSYSVRPYHSEVFVATELDNVERLQALFSSGDASPFDCSTFGDNLLYSALVGRAPKVFKLLVDVGLNASELGDYGRNDRNPLMFIAHSQGLFDDKKHTELTKLVLSHCPIPELEHHNTRGCQCPTAPDWESFRLLQPLLCPKHSDTPLYTRLEKARALIIGNSVENIKEVLNPDWTEDPHKVCNDTANTEHSLLHTLAGAIAKLSPDFRPQFSAPKFRPQFSTAQVENWLAFARDVVVNTDAASLHPIARNCDFAKGGNYSSNTKPNCTHTPFIHLLLRFHVIHHRFTRAQRERQAQVLLRQWLQILKEGGVDLDKYGRRENAILHDVKRSTARWVVVFQSVARPYNRFSMSYIGGHRQFWYLIGFTFGPNMEDWIIWWNEPTDEFAGDFWKLVENPPQRVPGEWYDEDIDATSDSSW